jgi:plasmid stabilization system protein ParE
MIPGVRLRKEVPADLSGIIDYFHAASPATAERFVQGVIEALRDLSRAPGMGSPKHFRNPRYADIRSWWVPGFPKYLILYRPVSGGIEVWVIVHGSRNLPVLLRKRV